MARFILTVAMFFATTVASMSATFYVVGEPEALGGVVDTYLSKIESFRKDRTQVRLPRRCVSSCTLYLTLLKDGLVCTRGGTTLVFHKFKIARTIENGKVTSFWIDPERLEAIYRKTWLAYPPIVRQKLPQGLPEWGEEVEVSARELNVPNC